MVELARLEDDIRKVLAPLATVVLEKREDWPDQGMWVRVELGYQGYEQVVKTQLSLEWLSSEDYSPIVYNEILEKLWEVSPFLLNDDMLLHFAWKDAIRKADKEEERIHQSRITYLKG